MPTREEIEKLKKDWLRDPIWDIEETKGFEAHRAELLTFSLQQQELWKVKKEEIQKAKMEKLGINNVNLLIYIESLEYRINELEEAGNK